jgi:hypothetical protein
MTEGFLFFAMADAESACSHRWTSLCHPTEEDGEEENTMETTINRTNDHVVIEGVGRKDETERRWNLSKYTCSVGVYRIFPMMKFKENVTRSKTMNVTPSPLGERRDGRFHTQ